MLKTFEAELLKDDWSTIRDGLEVNLCDRPRDDGNVSEADEDREMFILCRSRDRSNKEGAMVQRVEQRIEERLIAMTVEKTEEGHARIEWKKIEASRDWATLSAGCYILRTNVTDWSDEQLWKAYIQLTEAEAGLLHSQE